MELLIYTCGVPAGSDEETVTFYVQGESFCTQGEKCHCQRSTGCKMICGGKDQVSVGACDTHVVPPRHCG